MADAVSALARTISDTARKYGLKTLHFDATDVTLITRVGISQEVFLQVYANTKKDKLNMALVVAGERIYGIDNEGGFYHEHPFEDPSCHIAAEKMDIEDFVVRSLELLRKINLI